MRNYFTYIMASKKDGVIYVGVTNDLLRRVYEHKNGLIKGFTKKYFIKKLVYYEGCNDINAAIAREKQFKNWRRQWKINLIKEFNPEWKDLYNDLILGKNIQDPKSSSG